MRFVSYMPRDDKGPRFRNRQMGVVIDNTVASLTDIDSFYDDLTGWKGRAATLTSGTIPLDGLLLAPPVPRDAKIICAAINYHKHGAEANLPSPDFPNLFARWTSQLAIDGDSIPVPQAEPDGLDWEGELAAIVGDTLIDADEATAEAGVFGYTVANEVSARGAQLQSATLSTGQWALGKNPDRSAAVGSFIQTPDGVDVRDLTLETIVDGKTMQSGTTGEMIFSVAEILAFASRHVTLRPGDLVLTGTPDGVGLGRNPRIYMKPGAEVTVRITGLGSITNKIVGSDQRR